MRPIAISTESTMREVLGVYPGAQRALMRKYHIGGCQSCGFAPDEQLGDVLDRHNVPDAGAVIAHIQASHEQEQQLQISPTELAEGLKSNSGLKLVDVRSDEEFAIAKIDGALPATQALVQEMMTSWPKDAPIVTYCHHGIRSLEAASYLIGHGFTNVKSLSGGIDAWAEQVDTSVARY